MHEAWSYSGVSRMREQCPEIDGPDKTLCCTVSLMKNSTLPVIYSTKCTLQGLLLNVWRRPHYGVSLNQERGKQTCG